ncbi:MAG TPA: cupin domain-containing protein [Candidatus Lokiarchaeia archaeon]|nr:cupin domain-containing protein [Candidatus Lokiarchaeia archaeon]
MKVKTLKDVDPIEQVPGIARKTMCYNDEAQLCHFDMKKGSIIELHQHDAAQIGYVIKGRIEFWTDTKDNKTIVGPGDSYIFPGNVVHGAFLIKDSEVVECFAPTREEYKNE